MEKKNYVKLILSIFFIMIAGLVYWVSGTFIEPKFGDMNVSLKEASPDIVLVVIDDKSIQQQRWPWSREYYAEMFDFLENKAQAKAILFDAVLSSPDPYSANSDEKFYNYLKTTKKLVAGFDLCIKTGDDKKDNDCKIPNELNDEFNSKFDINIQSSTAFIKRTDKYPYYGVASMPEGFIKSINKLGSVVESRDDDRTTRKYNHLVYLNGKYYPSLALTGYSLVTGEKNFTFTKNSITANDSGLEIPLQAEAYKAKNISSYLKWYKPIDNDRYYSHKEYSAIDVLHSSRQIKEGKKPDLDPSIFKDKIVFVGGNASAQSLKDKISTPVSQDHAGVDIQATALNNYLENSFTRKADLPVNIAITVVIVLISFILICYLPPVTAIASILSLLFVYFLAYKFCLDYKHYIIDFITVFLIEILLIAFAYIYQFFVEGEKKDKMQKAVGKYLSADVLQRVVKDGDSITLGGRKTNATIMFIDIRRFTTISENMSADDVSNLLNEYFTTIYPIITRYKGVLNKFIGDAVLVIFTNSDETSNHAQNAVLCADKVLQEVKRLQQKWIQEGKPRIDVGVGINSGEVFIGNIGTQERMEYTVIGDTVNTASRIEGYNKMYKTKFLIGENTFELVKSYVDVIKINQVAIRGKTQKVNIYEILRIRKQ